MIYAPTRPDFWNDPRLWDGITEPRKQMCWMEREVPDHVGGIAAGTSTRFSPGEYVWVLRDGGRQLYPVAELQAAGHCFIPKPWIIVPRPAPEAAPSEQAAA